MFPPFLVKMYVTHEALSPLKWHHQQSSELVAVWSWTNCSVWYSGLMFWTMLNMRLEVVAFTISISSRVLILLGSLSKCKIVMVSFIGRISCPAFRMCSEKVDLPVDVANSFLCSLNMILKFLFVLPTSWFCQIKFFWDNLRLGAHGLKSLLEDLCSGHRTQPGLNTRK